jgi:hypothetical protein
MKALSMKRRQALSDPNEANVLGGGIESIVTMRLSIESHRGTAKSSMTIDQSSRDGLALGIKKAIVTGEVEVRIMR